VSSSANIVCTCAAWLSMSTACSPRHQPCNRTPHAASSPHYLTGGASPARSFNIVTEVLKAALQLPGAASQHGSARCGKRYGGRSNR